MPSSEYDPIAWMQSQVGRDVGEIILEARHEIADTDWETSGVEGAVAKREAGAVDFAISLKRLVFFLESKTKPSGVTNSEWMVMRDIIQELVDKGQLNADTLDVFKKP